MQLTSIDLIYQTNDEIRERLKTAVGPLNEDQLTLSPEAQTWTVSQLVEHIAMVNEGIGRISAKLISGAEAAGSLRSGDIGMSDNFKQKTIDAARQKFVAPEIVQPKSGATVPESLAKLDANREVFESIREKFARFDGTVGTFPHPFFGDLNADEWLILSGAHEARHLRQLGEMIESFSPAKA